MPTYWLELNSDGNAERQISEYPNGNILSYDEDHLEDEFDGLALMVMLEDTDPSKGYWAGTEITKEDFEARWAEHVPMNRDPKETKPAEQGEDTNPPPLRS